MRIAFTGHRDRVCGLQDLQRLWTEHPHSEWITGGAIGFDNQVEAFCVAHGIPNTIFKPDYARYGRSAPLKRNLQII